ncbi:FxLYD domain-containing protein [Micromonospora sonneratiae]|uniref:FxLYD domain-containing protein n=1 Tax=Micromonospora sonneratiae TaxID=1184706 RepID=A0ABW3YP34_9ACTN
MTYNDPYGQQPQPPVSGQPISPSYYPPPGPPPPPWPGPPKQDDGRKFLNMSGGILILVISAVILVCCIGPILFCVFGGFLGAVSEAGRPDPTVVITSCQVSDETKSATIEYTIKNNSDSQDSYSVKFEVVDAAGVQVGTGFDFVSSVGPGTTVKGDTFVITTGPGGSGAQCKVTSVD